MAEKRTNKTLQKELTEDQRKIINLKISQLKGGLLSYMVLLTIDNNKAYALNILQTLKNADLLVVEGTLYPLLSRFKREGLLDYTWKESLNGPPRKYYSLTTLGQEALFSLENYYQKLSTSVEQLKTKNNIK